jgi:dynein light intermediate chain 1
MAPRETDNEWETLLSETGRKHDKETSAKTVVLLGDVGAGKRTLLTKLTKKEMDEEPLRGNSLGYTFMDVTTDETDLEDGSSRMNIWTMPGEEKGDLLNFAINKETFAHLLVVIAIDLAQPHKIDKSLEQWTKLLQSQIDKVTEQVDPAVADECQKKIKQAFQLYSEPEEPDPTKPKADADDKVKLDMPIPDGVLTNNLGVPIVVVACKADQLETMEKEQRLRAEQIDYMQAHMRQFCLKYGAALVYTSTHNPDNFGVLKEYMTHVSYGTPFSHRAQVADRSTVFVPWGWDSESVIANTLSPSKQTFSEALPAPPSDRRASELQSDSMLQAEDDQEFLKTQKEELEKVAKSGPIITSAPAAADGAEKPTRKPSVRPSGTSSRSSIVPGATGERRASTKPGEPGAAGQPSDEALVNFFHSLLNRDKNAPGAVPARKASEKPKPP